MTTKNMVALLVLCTVFLVACSGKPSYKEVPGSYSGEYAGGVESFVINPDGSFHQEFTRNGTLVYSNSGKWELDGRHVEFRPFMEPDGVGDIRETAPKKYTYGCGRWHGMMPIIIFSDDERYWITKQE